MSGMTFAPVVVFGYNRPDHLTQTLDALAQADGSSETELWIFCDGPKPSQSADQIEAVRAVARDPKWQGLFAQVHAVVAPENKGLANSIIGGVTHVIELYERVIVLEDDLLVSQDFLTYLNACLDFYREDQSVGSVTGFCPLQQIPQGYPHDVMAVPRNCSHGWGTWRDRWAELQWDGTFANRVWHDRHLRTRMNIAGEDRLVRLQRQYQGVIDSWSIRFGAWQVATGRATIYPRDNRVLNIGFDGTGVHCGTGTPTNETIEADLTPPKLWQVSEDKAILAAFREAYSGPLHRRILRRLRLLLARQLHT